ncbi:tetratricopeptide repeat protein [Candidatus Accumulibacter sp. ACC003]|uniref:tetratricopeptide repeat protein n=1 Tax=Candidatus Accumulibacter sp. ACC003 TaxID=2823334 RepID=UPI0025BBC050|nr:tetratricopeptide repeat protein [Candidatus Accumulibacter sp. ACC003]
MSLLMDALRRAEEAKRQNSAGGRPAPAASSSELRLDPLESPSASAPPPSLSEELAAVDSDLAAAERTASRHAARLDAQRADLGRRQAAERDAARNVFAVKQLPRSRTSLWLFLGLIGVAGLAIGGYFWWQLQSIAGGSLAAPTTTRPPPALPASATEPASAAPLAAAAPVPPEREPAAASLAPPAPPPARAAARSSPAQRAASAPRSGQGEVFQRSNGRQQQAQTLNRAYQAWQADRLDDALRGYEQVLRGDPRNADALLGVAAIAARQGQLERAQAFYLRVLESDPTDVTAQAALSDLRSGGDAGQSESRLKTLLASQPQSPALYFALGNQYARQQRWNDAQQAYFQAYALEPGNADYVFNVAVSLDHLRQTKLAAQYYRMALSAATTWPSAFDQHAAEKRLFELQP